MDINLRETHKEEVVVRDVPKLVRNMWLFVSSRLVEHDVNLSSNISSVYNCEKHSKNSSIFDIVLVQGMVNKMQAKILIINCGLSHSFCSSAFLSPLTRNCVLSFIYFQEPWYNNFQTCNNKLTY